MSDHVLREPLSMKQSCGLRIGEDRRRREQKVDLRQFLQCMITEKGLNKEEINNTEESAVEMRRILNSNLPPEAEILPRRGTRGIMSSSRRLPIFSMSSHRMPEWPRIKEFMRTKMAPRTHDSGIEVEVRGSERGRGPGMDEVSYGSTPAC